MVARLRHEGAQYEDLNFSQRVGLLGALVEGCCFTMDVETYTMEKMEVSQLLATLDLSIEA